MKRKVELFYLIKSTLFVGEKVIKFNCLIGYIAEEDIYQPSKVHPLIGLEYRFFQFIGVCGEKDSN